MTGVDRKLVLTRIDGPVATLTLNRPDRHNSLVPELLREFGDALARCESQPDVGVLVVRAAGRSFSTGGDLRGFREHEAEIAQYAHEVVGLLNDVIIGLYDCRVPVVTVVNGQVTGGAIGFVLASDVVLVTERASFTPYYVEAGFSPDGGWATLLPDIIGGTRARTVQLLNQTITAGQALDWGLATAYADSSGQEQAVAELCGQILGKKPGSMSCTRSLLRPRDLESRLERERKRFVEQIATDEAKAGIRAWLGDA
ncbi:MAG TPA: enoyl-CoA hydratase/isomerase family protein [Woeseiaceae bacterium]|nr:enoyl-CoA hydratase/isomerase family protein [Woeseiaceae bacterium]